MIGPQKIFHSGRNTKMAWVYAASNLAFVVYFFPFFNWSIEDLIRNTVCIEHFSAVAT